MPQRHRLVRSTAAAALAALLLSGCVFPGFGGQRVQQAQPPVQQDGPAVTAAPRGSVEVVSLAEPLAPLPSAPAAASVSPGQPRAVVPQSTSVSAQPLPPQAAPMTSPQAVPMSVSQPAPVAVPQASQPAPVPTYSAPTTTPPPAPVGPSLSGAPLPPRAPQTRAPAVPAVTPIPGAAPFVAPMPQSKPGDMADAQGLAPVPPVRPL